MVHAAERNDANALKRFSEQASFRPDKTFGGVALASHAARFGAADAVKLLRDAGCDVSRKDRFGLSVRDWALLSGHAEILDAAEVPSGATRPRPDIGGVVIRRKNEE